MNKKILAKGILKIKTVQQYKIVSFYIAKQKNNNSECARLNSPPKLGSVISPASNVPNFLQREAITSDGG